MSVDLTFLELRSGDRVLLCSDGLCGLVHDSVIEEAMAKNSDARELCDRLIALANDAGGHDNITCVIAEFDGDLDLPAVDQVAFYQQYPLPLDESKSKNTQARPVIRSMVPRPLINRERVNRYQTCGGHANSSIFLGYGEFGAVVVCPVDRDHDRREQKANT